MHDEAARLWPFLFYFLAVIGLTAGVIAGSHFIGQRHRSRAAGIPYESGMLPTGSARLRFTADFYLIAMLFVIFDLESIFIFAWAVAVRDLGWRGYAVVGAFMAMLVAALIYLWRTGALDWEHPRAGEDRA